MKKINFNKITSYINLQKVAAFFFVFLILTAYSVVFKDNSPIEFQKQKLINVVTNQQEKGISTLAVTSLPFWLVIRDKITDEKK
jgi:hypothetical protein